MKNLRFANENEVIALKANDDFSFLALIIRNYKPNLSKLNYFFFLVKLENFNTDIFNVVIFPNYSSPKRIPSNFLIFIFLYYLVAVRGIVFSSIQDILSL